MAETSCAELFSGAPVVILHVPADCASPLNVARYLAVIRLTAQCSPVGTVAVWIPSNRLRTCQARRGPGGLCDASLRRSESAPVARYAAALDINFLQCRN